MDHILRALCGEPWAIARDWLPALRALAMREPNDPALEVLRTSGHTPRYEAALASMGDAMEGARRARYRDGVASIPIFGPIFPRSNMMTEMSGATSLDLAAADMRAAFASDRVHSILLVVDSPGGAVSGTAEFAGLVASAAKPVHAHVTGLGASAAYWAASAASSLTIDRTAMLGSIGVVMSGAYQEAADRNGYRQVDIVSSNAANKRPDLSTDEGRAVVQAQLDALEKAFIDDVAKGRKTTPARVVSDFGGGGVLVGEAAVAAGMADQIGTLEETLSRLSRPSGGQLTPRRAAAAEALSRFDRT